MFQKRFLAIATSVVAWAWAVASQHDPQPKHYVIFVGNPGSGKSTIMNSMFQSGKVKSGLSFGGGLTQLQDEQEWTDEESNVKMTFVDTPGLADPQIRAKAAKEIEDGLKKGGKYTIMFIVTQINGRLSVQDKTSMELVLGALPSIKDDMYGVVVNQIPKAVYEQFQIEENLADFVNSLWYVQPGKAAMKKTCHITLIKMEPDMEGQSQVFFPKSSGPYNKIRTLIDSIDRVDLQKPNEQVHTVQATEFDKKQEEMEEAMRKLREDKETARQETERNAKEIEDLRKKMENAHLPKSCDTACKDLGHFSGVISGTAPTCYGSCNGCDYCIDNPSHMTDYGHGCASGYKRCCCTAKPPQTCQAHCRDKGYRDGAISGTAPACRGSCDGCDYCIHACETHTDYGHGCSSGYKYCCCSSTAALLGTNYVALFGVEL